jgi:hypothetical protein
MRRRSRLLRERSDLLDDRGPLVPSGLGLRVVRGPDVELVRSQLAVHELFVGLASRLAMSSAVRERRRLPEQPER